MHTTMCVCTYICVGAQPCVCAYVYVYAQNHVTDVYA